MQGVLVQSLGAGSLGAGSPGVGCLGAGYWLSKNTCLRTGTITKLMEVLIHIKLSLGKSKHFYNHIISHSMT